MRKLTCSSSHSQLQARKFLIPSAEVTARHPAIGLISAGQLQVKVGQTYPKSLAMATLTRRKSPCIQENE